MCQKTAAAISDLSEPIAKSRVLPSGLVTKANILLTSQGTTNQEISKAEIKRLLSDKQCSGHPTVSTAEQVMKIVNLACCKLEDYGYEVSQWSLLLLVKEIEKQGIADHISKKTVGRFLKGGKFAAA